MLTIRMSSSSHQVSTSSSLLAPSRCPSRMSMQADRARVAPVAVQDEADVLRQLAPLDLRVEALFVQAIEESAKLHDDAPLRAWPTDSRIAEVPRACARRRKHPPPRPAQHRPPGQPARLDLWRPDRPVRSGRFVRRSRASSRWQTTTS